MDTNSEHDAEGWSADEWEGDDEDPIVKRMPLFLSSGPDFSLPSLAHFQPILEEETKDANSNQTKAGPKKIINPLTLLQYPFKPHNPTTPHVLLPPSLRPESNSNSTSGQIYAKFKPGVRHLNLEVPLETKLGTAEGRFSDERAREYAKGLPDKKAAVPGVRSNAFGRDDELDPLEKITLGSTFIPEQTNYFVGILKPGSSEDQDQLHLVPLGQTLQLRPSLDYLDRLAAINAQADKAAKREEGIGSESEDDSGDEETEEMIKKKALAKKKTEANEAKAIQVSVAGPGDSDKLGGGRPGGGLFAPIRAAEAETPIPLTHYHCHVSIL
ncbi:uncharacterized protein MELLADRAFT_86458 [Melampsora larici-populina 98AG31]|uniref:Uncharacterized protein n=1 Tax=Melampsora larici-populina (strain 98AG31 / pathotype 3-4-7) TaxID=747676 RepID=F4RLW6_MELLP|nr:uncharacterized protein MELLADRAFT_86458 [Melampsora larici-populina 98AG31]EGG06686.1 hypothetical protein MELLADRAFT_86458 [Melampsora larici-populina 98AG31]